eukprot:COSAG06_NODE_8127_length_2267_cov_1.912823_2_plen_100_part_00
MGDEEAVSAIKEALIANEPKTAPIDPRFPNTNQVRRQLKPLFPRMMHSDAASTPDPRAHVYFSGSCFGRVLIGRTMCFTEQVLLRAVHQVPALPEGERR